MPNREPQWGSEILRLPPRRENRGVVDRPYPPSECGEHEVETFVVDPRFAEWIRDTFLSGDGPLFNEEHAHLLDAHIGVLWTNAINVSKQRTVLGTAEIPQIQAGGWKRARFELQLRQWFGKQPDFLLTFSGPECERLSDRAFCALVSHELHHCGQAVDRDGNPKFSQDGRPQFAIIGHDLEQFIGVVRQFGITSHAEREFIRAASQAPEITDEVIDIACGTCLRAA